MTVHQTDEEVRCPHCQSSRVDLGATGLNQCEDCDGLFRTYQQVGLLTLPLDWKPGEMLPVEYLRETGLLWLINRVVFHPRGYALALRYDRPAGDSRKVIGFELQGDGSEPWMMNAPGGPVNIDEHLLFRTVEEFIRLHAYSSSDDDGADMLRHDGD